MTRFARAKGSKASNLKSPEDSTPWEVMKEQLLKSKKDIEENKNREEAEKQRIDNYNNFLKEQKTQKRKATWCDFSEAQVDKNINCSIQQNEKIHKNKNKKKKLSDEQSTLCIPEYNSIVDTKDKKDKFQKKKNLKDVSSIESLPQEVNNDTLKNKTIHTKQNDIQTEQNSKKAKKNKKKKHKTNVETTETIAEEMVEDNRESIVNQQNATHIEPSLLENRKKKNKKRNKESKINNEIDNSINKVENQTDSIQNNNMTDQVVHNGKKKKNKKCKQVQIIEENKEPINNSKDQVKKLEPLKKKDRPKKGNKAVRRKPINDRSFQLIINSKEVELIRFDGFPIMKKDAERLEELKKSMIKKGIPKSEVQRTLKLERRRAEKALARLKRDVCYNCRKGGHNLSDCPELKSNIPGVGAAEGVCFKCGSTEHRQFECKVQRDKEFRFATCFICKESGHIARQCPDNPKGLYPNGGSCKLCGDVTHLRKDCPTVNDKKESSTIKLQTLNEDGIEDISQNVKPILEETVKKPKKIKF